ncbi:energy transducer TonB [uncultured Bacteroides sp.]|uniref:energy transducer TonB n=1 Tax=uncultured Bacteroides sp. TaxID=162156 RepID=UPI002AAB4047|nr:energy transducer TonB [uncultured Bacteroides sp.]
MKTEIFTILLLILTLNSAYAQVDCQKAKQQAKLDFDKSEYSFHSEEFLPIENTYLYVLREYYKIYWYFTDSLGYYNCYDNEMTELLKTKHGDNFLNRARIIADSLETSLNWKKDPQFPGGDLVLFKYISSGLVKRGIKKEDLKINLYIRFIVNSTGKVSNPEILRGINKDIDEKVITIINQMPNWIPGYLYGKPTRRWYVMPIRFEY